MMTGQIEHCSTLLIEGWNVGFNKVAFTNMLKHELNLSLTVAKNMTDQVLERKPLVLNVAEIDIERIRLLAQKLGAIVRPADSLTSVVAGDACR